MYLNESLFSEFIADKEIMWLGIDFSKSAFTKDGFDFPIEVLLRYFNEWNLLIISDQKKYDIRMAFRKPMMHYDLSVITKKNKAIKLPHLLVNNLTIRNQISENAIVEYVQELPLPMQTRFSLLVLVESLDQKSKTASIWVVVVENNSSQVVLSEKFMESPGGFGLRNYWGRAFYNLFLHIQKKDFLRWTNLIQPDNLIQ
jgi:hypothetical protein